MPLQFACWIFITPVFIDFRLLIKNPRALSWMFWQSAYAIAGIFGLATFSVVHLSERFTTRKFSQITFAFNPFKAEWQIV